MVKKMIEVEEETHRRVMHTKLILRAKSQDETINRILDIVDKIEEAKQ